MDKLPLIMHATIRIIFCLFPLFCFSNLNWDCWNETSPYGRYEFDYDGYGTFSLNARDANQESISHLKRWYFYKGHVIGIYADFSKKKKQERYFIYNEEAQSGTRFSSKAAWEKCLQTQHLKPKIWTRWFSGPWWLDVSDNIFFFPVFLMLWAPLALWFYVVILKNALKYERFKLSKGYTITCLSMTFILISCLFKQFVPYSF